MAQLVQHLPRMQSTAGSSPAQGSSSFSLGRKELSLGVIACICLVSITDYTCRLLHACGNYDPHSIIEVILYNDSVAGVDPVTFSEWEAIDEEEKRVGEERGKPREKVVELEAMMNIIRQSRQ